MYRRVEIHRIKSHYVRIPLYVILLPFAIIALMVLFGWCGIVEGAAGFYRGFTDGNNLFEKNKPFLYC